MERVYRGASTYFGKGVDPGVLGWQVPSEVYWQIPRRGPGGQSSPEARAKCEISEKLLTRKFRI